MNIKDKLINNSVTSFLWFGKKFLKYRVPMLLCSGKPVDPKKVVFMSFNGKNYSDNPRAVSEKLHELHPEYTVVWGMDDPERAAGVLPDYARCVRFGSFSWYKELATAGCWVCSVLLPNGVLKRKGQRYIQTWHGDRGMKKILFDATESMDKYKNRNRFRKIIEPELCDLGTAGSEYGIMQYRSAMRYNGKLLTNGIPRNDCLVNLTEERRAELKAKIGIPADANLLLFAPTFRDAGHGAVQKTSQIDLPALCERLSARTGEKWCCAIRGHSGIHLENSGNIMDLTSYEDMADILCVTELLITDYSSTPGDLALTGRGTILYQDDYRDYVDNNRELYFKMEDSPFLVARDPEELNRLIDGWSPESAARNAKEILDFYKTTESGHSAESVVRFICGEE